MPTSGVYVVLLSAAIMLGSVTPSAARQTHHRVRDSLIIVRAIRRSDYAYHALPAPGHSPVHMACGLAQA